VLLGKWIWFTVAETKLRFAYVASLQEEGKQMHVVCKDIAGLGNETASCKVLPLGNNVYNMASM
jgi:hypothetical protein